MTTAVLGKDQLVFDPTAQSDSDNVGAYVTSADGTLITHTTIGAKEALDVNIVNGPDDGSFAEDAPHTTADIGAHILSVRKDALAANTDTDGDYASLLTNIRGAMWTAPVGTSADDAVDTESPVKIGHRADSVLTAVSDGDRADSISDIYRRHYVNDSANIGLSNAAQSVDDTVGGTQLVVAALASRKNLLVQNLDNKAIYLGATGVTTANGIKVGAGGYISLDIGPNIDMYAIGDAAGADVRILELG
jgi:hypothetical protein